VTRRRICDALNQFGEQPRRTAPWRRSCDDGRIARRCRWPKRCPTSTVVATAASGRHAASRRAQGKERPVRHLFVAAIVVAALTLAAPPAPRPSPEVPEARPRRPGRQHQHRASRAAGRLPGVGPKTAARIVVRQRTAVLKVEELMNVRGIGEKAFLKMKNQLTVTAPGAEAE
jgi:hypothetical protein